MKSLGNFPDPFIAEIAGQPDALRRAGAGLQDQAPALTRIEEEATGRRVVFTGMGSSYDACYPAVVELAQAGRDALMLDAAELLHFRMGMLGPDTLVVAVSQSGESAEVVRAVEGMRERSDPPFVVSVTNGTANALHALADLGLDTRAGEETGPSSMTFAASLAVVGALGRSIVGRADAIARTRDGCAGAAASIEELLADATLPGRLVAWLGDRRTIVILGRGPARAAAEMGALTIKETAGIAVESLQTAQFRHGPLELAGPDLAAIVIATEPQTRELDLELSAELLGQGAAVLTIEEDGSGPHGARALALATGRLDPAVGSAVTLVPIQLLARQLSILRGRDPGTYYRASKVTTRE